MEAYVVDWLNLLARWLHFTAGIAWIGSSFYFIWLDNHLLSPKTPSPGIAGEVWSVHGGGFYRAEKFSVAPPSIPEPLHWFKWEAYTTLLSGLFLLALVYWYGAEVYLVDPSVMALSKPAAVAIAAAFIAGGWLVYDFLMRSPLGRDDRVVAAILLVLVTLLAWALTGLFSGRGAYIHFGAVLGTVMALNVFFVIIPAQKDMVAAAAAGTMPDPAAARRARQRSVHNTYFTLPVLFTMISNHFAMTYNHRYAWLILVAISLAGALIRVYFVSRHKGRPSRLPAAIAVLLLAAVAVAIAPKSQAIPAGAQPAFAEVAAVIDRHCVSCHAEVPAHPAFPAPPAGVLLQSRRQIEDEAMRIHQQTVVTRAMPIGNITGMTEEERQLIARWYEGSAAR